MFKTFIYCLAAMLFSLVKGFAQQYYKGKVVDAVSNKPLASVKIIVANSNAKNLTDSYGTFGVMANLNDTAIFEADGYEPKTVYLKQDFTTVLLKPLVIDKTLYQQKYTTITNGLKTAQNGLFSVGGETYYNITENPTLQTNLFSATSFTLNTNKSSFSNMRRFINSQQVIPADVIRIEEMLNYFNVQYNTAVNESDLFSVSNYISTCPWDNKKQLLNIQIQSKKIAIKNRKANKITMLIDCSGSMHQEKRLPVIQAAFRMLQKQMLPTDTLSIITFGTNVTTWLDNNIGTDAKKILPIVDSLDAEGDTPGEYALLTAYNCALKNYNPLSNNRIILCTDGDFNVGETDEEALGNIVSRYKETGIYLTCLGIGKGNFKNSKLEKLAKKGNGNLAYIDSEAEAEKVLVKEGLQTLVSIADNVSVKINFDTKKIASYRLLGFDNILNPALEQLNEIEGGTVGSGHIINALFEITTTLPLTQNDGIANVTIDYSLNNNSKKLTTNFKIDAIYPNDKIVAQKIAFNNGIAGLGLVFRNSPFKNNWNLNVAKNYLLQNPINDAYLQADVIRLIDKALKFYPKKIRGRGK